KEKVIRPKSESRTGGAFGTGSSNMTLPPVLTKRQGKEIPASAPLEKESKKVDVERIGRVYRYVMENYQQPVSLEEIASVANLSQTSFCRYFKMMAKKTFYDFLTEVRISHAKMLLIEDHDATTAAI